MFSTEDAQELQGHKYISPGIHEITILGITNDSEDESFFTINMKLKDGEESNNKTERIYWKGRTEESTKKLLSISKSKLGGIIDATLSEEARIISADNFSSWVTKLNDKLAGKSLRCKFIGRKYQKLDGTEGVRASLPFKDFTESITDGTVKPKLSKEESKLTFDINNPFDYEKPTNSDAPAAKEDVAWGS